MSDLDKYLRKAEKFAKKNRAVALDFLLEALGLPITGKLQIVEPGRIVRAAAKLRELRDALPEPHRTKLTKILHELVAD